MKTYMLPGRWIFIGMMSVFLMSCSILPIIKSGAPATPDILHRCRQPFLDRPYRFVHAIEAALSGGGMGTVIGVTVFDPASETIHSTIMTIEGFVIFDARYEKEVRVHRAVPPFDGEYFAANMMGDIRLMFLAPHEQVSRAGRLEDGSSICRYVREGRILDVIVHQDDSWEIETYANRQERLRKIRAFTVRNSIPETLELTGFGFREYTLRLKLISAEPLTPEVLRSPPVSLSEEE